MIDFLIYSTIGAASDLIINALNECVDGVSGVGLWTSRKNCAVKQCEESGSRIIGTVLTAFSMEAFHDFVAEDQRYHLGTAKTLISLQSDIFAQACYLSQLQQFSFMKSVNDEIAYEDIDFEFSHESILANLKLISRNTHEILSKFQSPGQQLPLIISYEALRQNTHIEIGKIAELLETMHTPKPIRELKREHEKKHRQLLKVEIEEL